MARYLTNNWLKNTVRYAAKTKSKYRVANLLPNLQFAKCALQFNLGLIFCNWTAHIFVRFVELLRKKIQLLLSRRRATFVHFAPRLELLTVFFRELALADPFPQVPCKSCSVLLQNVLMGADSLKVLLKSVVYLRTGKSQIITEEFCANISSLSARIIY